MNIDMNNEWVQIGLAFVAGLVLMHLFWVKDIRWWLSCKWFGMRVLHHKYIIKCEGCENCDENHGLDEDGKSEWDRPRWHIGLSFAPKGNDPTLEDDVLFAKVGEDPDHSGFCFTHGVRDLGWTFYDDYARAHEAYHILCDYMPDIASSWGIVTQYHDGEVGFDWDWGVVPGSGT